MSATKQTHDIDDIAAEFDRVCPSQVDDTPRDYGHGYEAGHIGHGADDEREHPVVGWFCSAGSVGNPIAEIPADCIEPLYERLSGLPDGACDNDVADLAAIVAECGGEWLC